MRPRMHIVSAPLSIPLPVLGAVALPMLGSDGAALLSGQRSTTDQGTLSAPVNGGVKIWLVVHGPVLYGK
jgi:hypothetical protein